jgi:hypothetical protein
MRGQVLARAEQHFGDVPAGERPTQETSRSRRRKRKHSAQKSGPRRRNRPNPAAGHRWVKVSRGDHPSPAKRARGHEIPVMPREHLPRRSETQQTMESQSHLLVGLPPWGVEVGPAQRHFSRSGVPHDRHARPGGTTDGDSTDDGKRLALSFRGNTDMDKRESRIIAGTYRGKRK